MELRHLRYFVAIAETGSLTVAAEKKLFTSQPSLSRQIKDLEDQVGTPLLNRSARGVTLTEAGKAFLDHARLALHQVDAAVEAARRAAQPAKQRFSLGFLTGQEMTWLPEVMRVLRAELPNIEVIVSSDYSPDLGEAVARGRLDVAFMRAEPELELTYRRVAKEPLVALMPSDHALTARASVRAKDLVGLPFIAMASKAKVLRAVIDQYLEDAGIEITPRASGRQPRDGDVPGGVYPRHRTYSVLRGTADALVGGQSTVGGQGANHRPGGGLQRVQSIADSPAVPRPSG